MKKPLDSNQRSAEIPSRSVRVLALSIGSGLATAASLIFGIIASRWLTKGDYATLRQTFLAYDFVAPVLMLGLPTALYYFLPKEHNNKKGIIVDNISLLFLTGLTFSVFLACGGYLLIARRFDNPALLDTLPWLIPYPLIVMPTTGLAAVLVLTNRSNLLVVYNAFLSLTVTLFGIWAVLATKSYLAPVIARAFIPSLFIPIALYLMFAGSTGSVRWPCRSTMLSMIKYAVPLGAATILGQATLQLHAIIVSSMCTPEEFAVYINGATELPIVGIVTGSIATIILADMSLLCAAGEKPAALALFRRASTKAACVLFPTTCFLFVVATPFISMLYTNQYVESALPFRIYLLILPIRIVVYGSALMALGLTKTILVRSIFDLLVNAILCWILVRAIGYIGAPIALALTLYLWTTPFNILKISQGFGVQWKHALPIRELLAILALCVVGLPLVYLGMHGVELPNFAQIILSAALYWPLTTFLLYKFRFISIPRQIENLIPKPLKQRV